MKTLIALLTLCFNCANGVADNKSNQYYCDVPQQDGYVLGIQCGAQGIYWTWQENKNELHDCIDPAPLGASCSFNNQTGIVEQ